MCTWAKSCSSQVGLLAADWRHGLRVTTAILSGNSTARLALNAAACKLLSRAKRAIATANGFLSTPWTEAMALEMSTQGSSPGRCSCRLEKALERTSRKWPEPQAGSDYAQSARETRMTLGRGWL